MEFQHLVEKCVQFIVCKLWKTSSCPGVTDTETIFIFNSLVRFTSSIYYINTIGNTFRMLKLVFWSKQSFLHPAVFCTNSIHGNINIICKRINRCSVRRRRGSLDQLIFRDLFLHQQMNFFFKIYIIMVLINAIPVSISRIMVNRHFCRCMIKSITGISVAVST